MAITYRLTTYGFQEGRPRGPARALMVGLLQGEPEDIERLADRVLCGERLSLAGGLDKTEGERLRKALAGVGIEAKLYPESLSLLPVELEAPQAKTYRCPACHHEQEVDPLAPDTCKSCGVIGSKFDEVREIKDVLDAERRKLEARISEAEAAEIEQQRQREHERLREIGRKRAEQQLGITRMTKLRALLRSPALVPLAGGVAVAVLAGVGLWQYRVHQSPAPAAAQSSVAQIPGAVAPGPAPVQAVAADSSKRPQGAPPAEIEQAIAAAEAGTGGGRPGLTPQQAVMAVNQLASKLPGGGEAGPAAAAGFTAVPVAGPEAVPPAAAAPAAALLPVAPAAVAEAAQLRGIVAGAPLRLTGTLLDAGRLARLPLAPGEGSAAAAAPVRPEALIELARYARERGDFGAAGQALAAADARVQGPQGTAALADAVLLERIALTLTLPAAAAGTSAAPAAAGLPPLAERLAAARRLADGLFSDAARADACLLLAASAPGPGQALADFERARDFVRLTEPAEDRAAASGRFARALMLAGRQEAGQQEFVLAQSLADGLADRQARANALALLARLRAEAGDLAGAERLHARLGEQSPAGAHDAQWLAARAGLRASAGELAAAQVDIAAAYDRLSALDDAAAAAAGLMYLARRLQAAGDSISAERLVAGAMSRYAQDDGSVATATTVPAPAAAQPAAGSR